MKVFQIENKITEAEAIKINANLEKLNEELSQFGFPRLKLIDPKILQGQKKNARYFEPEKFALLVKNIKKDGRLESIPLCYQEGEKFYIISGHHRVKASVEAGLPYILVFITDVQSKDELISKQLSHNALVGKDDDAILKELFDSIKDIEQRMATGLADEIKKITYSSLNFRVGSFKAFTVLFLPEDIGLFDETIEQIENELPLRSDEEVRIGSLETFDRFAQTIRKIKKVENIKSNGVALARLVELAQERILESEMKSVTQEELEDHKKEVEEIEE